MHLVNSRAYCGHTTHPKATSLPHVFHNHNHTLSVRFPIELYNYFNDTFFHDSLDQFSVPAFQADESCVQELTATTTPRLFQKRPIHCEGSALCD